MYNNPESPSKPGISFVNKFKFESRIVQNNNVNFIHRLDFITWFIKSQEISNPKSRCPPPMVREYHSLIQVQFSQ